MQNIVRFTKFVLIMILVSACTNIFTDDFESDPAGGAPLAEPAGAPADSLSFTEGPGSVTVTNVLPLVGSQSLLIQGPGGDDTPAVIMTAAPISDLSQPVYVFWQGRLVSGARVKIKIWSDIIFMYPVFWVNLEDGIVFVNGDSVGNYTPNGQHGVQIGLFPDSDQYRLTMTGAADVDGTVVGTLPDPSVFPDAHIGLRIDLLSAESIHTYRMDDVVISHQN